MSSEFDCGNVEANAVRGGAWCPPGWPIPICDGRRG